MYLPLELGHLAPLGGGADTAGLSRGEVQLVHSRLSPHAHLAWGHAGLAEVVWGLVVLAALASMPSAAFGTPPSVLAVSASSVGSSQVS